MTEPAATDPPSAPAVGPAAAGASDGEPAAADAGAAGAPAPAAGPAADGAADDVGPTPGSEVTGADGDDRQEGASLDDIAVLATELAVFESGNSLGTRARERFQQARSGVTELPGSVQDRLGRVAAAALDRVFDEPLDIRTAAAAERYLSHGRDSRDGTEWVARLTAAEKLLRRTGRAAGLAAGTRKLLSRQASLLATVGMATSIWQGTKELQVLSSFLISRLRVEGLPVEKDFVRQVVLGTYVQPGRRPDLTRSSARTVGELTRTWVQETVPGMGGGGGLTLRARQRIHWLDQLDLRSEYRVWWERQLR